MMRFIWSFFGNGEEDSEDVEYSCPHYIEDDWLHLQVPIPDSDNVRLQFRENGINYEGPELDSYHAGIVSEPICKIFYFETEEELKKAGHVVWESEADLVLMQDAEGKAIRDDVDLYDFIDRSSKVEIV